jgi:aspartate aminotransferase-like enzyme
VRAALDAHPEARGVFVQASETSPARCTRRGDRRAHAPATTLLVVDGITAVGVVDLPMDGSASTC